MSVKYIKTLAWNVYNMLDIPPGFHSGAGDQFPSFALSCPLEDFGSALNQFKCYEIFNTSSFSVL